MTREEIAARIYANHYIRPSMREGFGELYVTPKQALKAADHFFKSIEKHREPKAVECEHVWTDPVEKGKFHCLYCGAPKVQPEPTKPERKAIFLVHESYLIDAETRSEMHKENLEANGYVYVHKVQPGGGGE